MKMLASEYSVQDVANAAGTAPRNVSDWVTRGYIIGDFAEGKHRRFSFSQMMEIALCVAAMEQFGFTPARALKLATAFAYTGEGGVSWNGEQEKSPERMPGVPFHHNHGITYLVAFGEMKQLVLSKDGCIDMTGFPPDYSDTTGLLVLNVSAIFMLVCARLGHDYRVVLDDIYEEALAG